MKQDEEQARWDQLRELIKNSPTRKITVEFMGWAVRKGLCIDDPLKSEFTFQSAWSAWEAGRETLEERIYMTVLAEWLDNPQAVPEPMRKKFS